MDDEESRAARIKAHINRSHQRDMSLYLRRFAFLPLTHEDVFSFAQLELVSIDTSGMAIRAASGTTYPIPFNPPLVNLGETRLRLVAMDAECRKALGLPPADRSHAREAVEHSPTVTKYAPPQGLERVVMAAVGLYLVCAALLPWMRQGTALGDSIETVWWFGGGLGGFKRLVEVLRLPVLGIHLGEAAWFHVSRMRKYGVQTGSALWWTWMLSVWLEGACAFKRIDRLATRLARKTGKTR